MGKVRMLNSRGKVRERLLQRPGYSGARSLVRGLDLRNERGASMAEYVFVTSLIAGVCFVAVGVFGVQVNLLFQSYTLN